MVSLIPVSGPSALGVPTNTYIQLVVASSVLQAYPSGVAYSLTSQTGATVALGPPAYFDSNVSITPATPLAPSTLYTFTITPQSTLGDPYSFDFTTGSGPDTSTPQLIGFSPPSGTTGTGTSGPFIALFNKRLSITALQGQAVSVRVPANGISPQPEISLTADGKGLVIEPMPQANGGTYWPESYQITVDPTEIQDVSGNPGQGVPQTAMYITFATQETSGAALKSFFPADGASGLPLNVSIRLLFSSVIDSTTAAAGIVLQAGGKSVPVPV